MIVLSVFLLATVILAQQTDTLKDTRDGKTYKTVKIGKQVWMAENLDYVSEKGSWCYDDDSSNCDKLGRLYDWDTAKKVCPAGWHLPTKKEFEKLQTAVEEETILSLSSRLGFSNDGNSLKAIGQGTGSGAGTNASGFSSLLAGSRNAVGTFLYLGDNAYFWSSSLLAPEYDNEGAFTLNLSSDNSNIFLLAGYKELGCSVRCVKD